VDLQNQTTQNPHTQAAARPSTILHEFRDIKAYLQQVGQSGVPPKLAYIF